MSNSIEKLKTSSKNLIIDREFISLFVQKLIQKKKTITCAESCTGGLLSSLLVENSGVSVIFKGSIIAYSNEVKMSLLGVNPNTLKKYGAVSKECIKEMLKGSLKLIDSDISMAVSGIAGPNGATKEKPVGTIYIGVRNRVGEFIIDRFYFEGDRRHIQEQAAFQALKMVLQLEKEIFL